MESPTENLSRFVRSGRPSEYNRFGYWDLTLKAGFATQQFTTE